MGTIYEFLWAAFLYLWAVFVHWWWLVTVILFGLDKALEWVWPSYRAWLSETFPTETRRRFFWQALFAFVFISGFLAWRGEHEQVVSLQKQINEGSAEGVRAKLAATEAQLAKLQARQNPRRLTDQQKAELTALLRPYSYCRGELESNQDPESVDFSEDFKDVLMNAGWKNTGYARRERPPIRSGVSVRADPQYLDMNVITTLLEKWNFEARGELLSGYDSCYLELEIGNRY